MGRVLKTPEARRDLLEIWVYIATNNYDAADRLMLALEADARRLADFPGMGQARDDLQPGLRSYPHGAYIIFYRRRASGIEIIRVLHGARDVENEFLDL